MTRRPQRNKEVVAVVKREARRLLEAGHSAASVAREIDENTRVVQRWAKKWAREGLLEDHGRSAYRKYSATDSKEKLVASRGAATDPATKTGRFTRESDQFNRDPPQESVNSGRRKGAFYAGPHYVWWKSAVVAVHGSDVDPRRLPLRRLREDGTEAMRGQRYLGGHHRVQARGGSVQVLVERYIPTDPAAGYGSINVRFDLRALPGMMPEDANEWARAIARRAIYDTARKYGLSVREPVCVTEGHHAIARHPIALALVPRYGKVEASTDRGKVSVDKSHYGGEWEAEKDRKRKTPPGEDATDLLKVGESARKAHDAVVDLRVHLDQVLHGDLEALWESLGRQEKTHVEIVAALRALSKTNETMGESVKQQTVALLGLVARQKARAARGAEPPKSELLQKDPEGYG